MHTIPEISRQCRRRLPGASQPNIKNAPGELIMASYCFIVKKGTVEKSIPRKNTGLPTTAKIPSKLQLQMQWTLVE